MTMEGKRMIDRGPVAGYPSETEQESMKQYDHRKDVAEKRSAAMLSASVGEDASLNRRSQPNAAMLIGDAAKSLYNIIDTMPQGRESALARTKLDECVMWALKTYRY